MQRTGLQMFMLQINFPTVDYKFDSSIPEEPAAVLNAAKNLFLCTWPETWKVRRMYLVIGSPSVCPFVCLSVIPSR